MINEKDISKQLNQQIEIIKSKVISGEITLLDLELNPLFQELENSLTTINLENYSETYGNAFSLLEQKFEELKNLLKSLNNDEILMEYLNNKPNELETYALINENWHEIFFLDSISIDFLFYSRERLSQLESQPLVIEHQKRQSTDENFIIEIPNQQFIQKLDDFLKIIIQKLPCFFEDIFEEERDQVKIYEKFIFLLHLLQSGRIKYQKETNTLYI